MVMFVWKDKKKKMPGKDLLKRGHEFESQHKTLDNFLIFTLPYLFLKIQALKMPRKNKMRPGMVHFWKKNS